MDFVLFYEGIERELQNAYLLKSELKRRGHTLLICEPYFMLNLSKEKLKFKPDAILVPYLYENNHLDYFKNIFEHKIDRIVNLQYEQIITKHHHAINLHIPKDLNKNALHLCWGEKWRDILIKYGVPEENCIVTGSINIDMDRERFRTLYKSRDEIAKYYNLDINKKWIIFFSSFAMINLTESRIHYNSVRFGEDKVMERINVDTKSRNIILKWIEKYLSENNDCEFIYRPHPGETLDRYIYDITYKYDNFHIIKNDSVRSWINVCDKLHTWASTTIVDIYFMKKNCSVLRPIPLADWMQNGLIDEGDFITDYEGFCEFNNQEITKFPIDESLILDNFYIDDEKYAYEKICDLLEDIVNMDLKMNLYND